jgi:hypothetical protein
MRGVKGMRGQRGGRNVQALKARCLVLQAVPERHVLYQPGHIRHLVNLANCQRQAQL